MFTRADHQGRWTLRMSFRIGAWRHFTESAIGAASAGVSLLRQTTSTAATCWGQEIFQLGEKAKTAK